MLRATYGTRVAFRPGITKQGEIHYEKTHCGKLGLHDGWLRYRPG
jgi:hypothetical protein